MFLYAAPSYCTNSFLQTIIVLSGKNVFPSEGFFSFADPLGAAGDLGDFSSIFLCSRNFYKHHHHLSLLTSILIFILLP